LITQNVLIWAIVERHCRKKYHFFEGASVITRETDGQRGNIFLFFQSCSFKQLNWTT